MDEDRLGRLEERLDDLERREGALEKAVARYRSTMKSVVPSQTRTHVKAAGREQLLAVRSLLDHWVDILDESGTKRGNKRDKPKSGRESIPID